MPLMLSSILKELTAKGNYLQANLDRKAELGLVSPTNQAMYVSFHYQRCPFFAYFCDSNLQCMTGEEPPIGHTIVNFSHQDWSRAQDKCCRSLQK